MFFLTRKMARLWPAFSRTPKDPSGKYCVLTGCTEGPFGPLSKNCVVTECQQSSNIYIHTTHTLFMSKEYNKYYKNSKYTVFYCVFFLHVHSWLSSPMGLASSVDSWDLAHLSVVEIPSLPLGGSRRWRQAE